ncbi:hypothetical protein [Acetobacter senegalensis]|uniref:hypothetical protein n=1 Tax=Acetobacter senegalensis TaxID=446692 RepID=UPI000776F440|nr:hypothetical protein [Acetobacter senegalensis]
MTTIAKNQSGAVALLTIPAEPSADLAAVLSAMQSGVPMTTRDLTQSRVDEARAIAATAGAIAPAPEIVIAAWSKKLIPLTVNPPTDPADSAAKISAICEICGDFPAGVWTPETRKAWVTQGPQGKFWPAPAELYAHLQPYADKIRRNVEGCRRIVKLGERAGKREEGVSAEERAAVARQMAEWRKSMGHTDAEPEQRRPVEPQPSVSERLAECRRQLAADPTQGVWLEPLIAQLEAQVMATYGKEPTGSPHSAAQVLAR